MKSQCRTLIPILISSLPGWAMGALNEVSLHDWRLIDTNSVYSEGDRISQVGYYDRTWTPAVVPGTVLTSYVKAGKYPEPLYGLNNLAIPESLCRNTYWYRTQVTVPLPEKGRQMWLNFDGINYAAEVWVNGHRLGEVRGAFVRGRFDITPFVKVGSPFAIAVKIIPPAHPGTPHEQTLAGGTGPNGGAMGGDGATFVSTVGWDWIPGIRDRNIGIWQPVRLTTTGPVSLHNPCVRTDLPLPRTDSASLSISSEVRNETSKVQRGSLVATVEGSRVRVAVPVTLNPGERQVVAVPQQTMRNPRLWWPNGYGQPNLYRLRLQFVQGENASDTSLISFGVRSLSAFEPGNPEMRIHVNGVPIMCRGGNWGIDEAMKRSPYERLDAQLRMHRDANCNIIRNWVGQSTQEDLYALCDKYGILVWDDFWLANPADGPIPLDNELFLANAREKVLRFRNHPSIAIWCGRNEGNPPPELQSGLAAITSELDPTRFYQLHSSSTNGVTGGGPYGQVPFLRYYNFTGSFHTEIGAPSIPTLESIKGMMPEKDWWPINDDWAYHDLTGGAQRGDRYQYELSRRFGKVSGFKDFVRKGALLTYETYRAMFEGRNSKLFAPASGVMLWMSHPAQPSFVWQLYHYDLDPTAAMYGAKLANEPIHIQMTPEGVVQLVNITPNRVKNLKFVRTAFGENGQQTEHASFLVDADPSQTSTILDNVQSPIVRLQLFSPENKLISENTYWAADHRADASFLGALPSVQLTGKAITRPGKVEVTLTNSSSAVALMAHLSLRNVKGERVLPAFASENYFHLYPGETRTVLIDGPSIPPKTLVYVDGWNVTVDGPGLKTNLDAKAEPPLSPSPPRSALPGTLVSIDCGGEDVAGSPWNPDDEFIFGGEAAHQPGPVTGSDLPADVLATERWGEMTYTVPVPVGQKVTLKLVFAETSQPRIAGRKFNIDINRKRVLTEFDIFAEAGGANKALVKEFYGVSPDRNGNIVIAFRRGSVNEPEVRAIQVLKE